MKNIVQSQNILAGPTDDGCCSVVLHGFRARSKWWKNPSLGAGGDVKGQSNDRGVG